MQWSVQWSVHQQCECINTSWNSLLQALRSRRFATLHGFLVALEMSGQVKLARTAALQVTGDGNRYT